MAAAEISLAESGEMVRRRMTFMGLFCRKFDTPRAWGKY
jgi:hypothetical protein